MELVNFLKDSSFTNVKDILSDKPYYITVKEDPSIPELYMLVYDRDKSDFSIPLVKECRGIILEKNTNKVVCHTLNRKDDIPIDEDVEYREYIDGSHIKLFCYNDEWRLSTTRCIDANKAYWTSDKSFARLFNDSRNVSCMNSYSELDENYCYGFVICHTDNRIVKKYECNKLYHVCSRNMRDYKIENIDIGVEKPRILDETEIENITNNIINDIVPDAIFITNNGKHNVIYNPSYKLCKDLRCSTTDMLYEYIMNCCKGDRELYVTQYEEWGDKFVVYDNYISNLINRLHRAYMDYHVNRVKILGQINKMYHKHLYALHGTRLANNTVITKDVVREYMFKLDAKQIIHMLNKTLNRFGNKQGDSRDVV